LPGENSGILNPGSLLVIVVGLVAVSIPFLYYWLKSLKLGTKRAGKQSIYLKMSIDSLLTTILSRAWCSEKELSGWGD
jgi:hypothetical protein